MAEGDFEIRVLGELEVVSAGRALPLPASKKTRALLGYLVTTGRPQLRPRLCELLWDGPDDPRAALRWSLNRLRPIVNRPGTDRLVADREHAAMRVADGAFDLSALRRDLGAGPMSTVPIDSLRRAADRFRGEFLEGLELPDCPRYHEWCQAERGEVRRLRLAILASLVQRLDDADARVRYARNRIAIDPYDEGAHADLVRLLARLGRADEATLQYQQCRRLLERDLGVRPSSELEAARGEIRVVGNAPAAHHPPAVAATADPRASAPALPLVGRGAALARLDALAAAARRDGTAGVALVMGEPGIGKSRLLDELARRTRAGGGCVLTARAFEVEMVRPYGLWLDAFRSLEGWQPRWPSALSPGAAPSTPPVPIDRALLLESARAAVTELAARAGLLAIVFDDIHWIDEESAALLHLVCRAAAGVLVVCAARPGEIDDNPAALRLVRTLRRSGQLEPVEIGPLDGHETRALVSRFAPSVDAAGVHAESGGNPLFAIEIARSRLRGDSALPESLRALIAERIAGLEPAARDVLLWAAAFGKSFRAEWLAAAGGLSDGELAAIFADLELRGFLAAVPRAAAPAYDFVHDVIRQAAYQLAPELRRRAVHKRIARALAGGAEREPELARDVSHHAALGGDAGLAARAALVAAERCQLLFANVEAIAMAERGLSHAAALPRPEALPLEIGLLKVEVCSGAGTRRRRELESALMRIVAEAQRSGASAAAADALYVVSILHHEAGNFPGAQASVARAVAASQSADARTKVRSLAHAGRCYAQIETDMAQASAMLAEAEALARREGIELPEIELEWGLGVVRHFTGEHEAAVALLDHALVLIRRDRDHWAECDCLIRIVMVALETGRFETALAPCRELAVVAAKMGEGSEGPAAETLDALARRALGEWGAGERLAAAIEGLRRLDAKGLLAYALTFAADLDLRAGRTDAALVHCEEALAAAGAVRRRSLVALAEALTARILGGRGERTLALGHLERGCLHLAAPLAVSARARAALEAAAQALGTSISTFIPTPAQTVTR